jgi:hypothetical protein
MEKINPRNRVLPERSVSKACFEPTRQQTGHPGRNAMGSIYTVFALISLLVAGTGHGQQGGPARGARTPNRLLTAKLMAVTSMPDGVDRWLIEDLRAWGRYRVTTDPEGADLVMRGYDPQKDPQLKLSHGIPQPRREKHQPPPVLSVTVIDWLSNQSLWDVNIMNKKARQGESEPEAGPRTEIDARGLSPAQLAQTITSRLRDYVGQLEKSKPSQR